MTSVKLYEGDSRQILIEMFERGEFVDSVVTDAPYHLDSIVKRFGKEGYKAAKFGTDGAFERASKNFIGQTWDGTDENGVKIAQDPEFWRLVFNVLKPGGYIVSFASSRTYGPMQVAMEEAGFITHPLIGWVNGSGMPKAHSAAYHLNRQNENELAAKWEGWSFGGQARKPAMEPIYVGQKPFSEKTCAKNIMAHGVGAVNIDACRTEDGKWPANIILDGSEEVAALFPDKADKFFENYPFEGTPIIYHRKANKEDRAGSSHATVKPIGLMRSLVRHVTPVGGTTLDPFAGSGTTGQAALEEGRSCILIEREETYCCDIKRRLDVNSDNTGTESLYLRILGIN